MRYMKRGCAVLLGLLILSTAVLAETEVNLRADAMRYDPNTRKVVATGNVHLVREGGELFAKQGEGEISGGRFKLTGGVSGRFPEENLTLKTDTLVFINSADKRILQAVGNVQVTRSSDRLTASEITWRLGKIPQYLARGDVEGKFEKHEIDADEVGRDRDIFWGKKVRRYEDKKQGFRLSAQKVNGNIEGEDVTELIAQGALVMRVTGKTGKPIHITGQKGVYSKDRGTVVISGGARAVQESRIVEAENLVLHLDTTRIEALGSPKITFPVKD